MNRIIRLIRRPRSRGQALVEFALVLPILALLLVMAVDFGRVFFGWVSLTNASRIAANYAAYTPSLLDTGKEDERADFEELLTENVTGCQLDPADVTDPAYDPVFTDTDGDGDPKGFGDHVTVTLKCSFDLMTPLASAIVGNSVVMSAESVFPIRAGDFVGPGVGPNPSAPAPCTLALVPDLLNRTVLAAKDKWVAEGFDIARLTVDPPTAADDWLVNDQVWSPPAGVQFCVDPAAQSVLITAVTPPPCPAGSAQVPDLLGLLVSDAKDAWADAGFTGDFKPSNAVDSKTVLTQVTSPVTSPPIGGCVTITAEVTITYGDPPPVPCDVPNLIGDTLAEANAAWTAAGFSTTLTSQGPAGGTVNQQTPNHPGTVSCDVIGNVRLKN